MRRAILAVLLALAPGAAAQTAAPAPAEPPRSAIFLHTDGMGPNAWSLVRLAQVGPDGRLAWDRLPKVAVYVGPMTDSVTASSNGGATSHAFGVRADSDSFGMVGGAPIPAARSGQGRTVMQEAGVAGKAIGVVNSSSITEAGTGVMLATAPSRNDHEAIAAQMLAMQPQVMLGGGERWFLPTGVRGVHGPGARTDGRDLIAEARALGYTVVRTKAELAALGPEVTRVLGLFAAEETFNEGDERGQLAGRPVFQPQAPRYDEMIAVALRLLQRDPDGYFLVANEEATDDLAGDNNAAGVIEAGAGADRAVGLALAAARANPHLTVIVAADSDCGGPQATGDDVIAGQAVPRRNENGAPQDGLGRSRTPFLAAPDREGRRLPFLVTWAAGGDVSGGLVARGAGPGAELLSGTIDSTDIYRALYLGLFGQRVE